MIRHIVLFKLNDGATKNDVGVAAAYEGLIGLGDKISELRSWQVGWNVRERAAAYDFAVIADVDDLAALQRYLDHPDHQAVVAKIRAVCTAVSADLEI